MLKKVPGYGAQAAVIHSPVRRSDERSKTRGGAIRKEEICTGSRWEEWDCPLSN
jgi:hypothetical protein